MALALHHPELQFSIRIVRQAARLVQQIQAELVTPALTKDDRSPVTVADFASQAVVAQALEQAFPHDPLIAEETAHALRAPDESERLAQVTTYVRRLAPAATPAQVCAWIDRGAASSTRRSWVLDPIDGTKGFLRGGQYVVALAWLIDGQVQIGILGCPNLRDGRVEDMHGPGSLVAAVRGEGAWVSSLDEQDTHFSRLQVSTCQDPAQARLLRSFEAGHTNVEKIDALAQRLGIRAAAQRMDSQAKYAILAAGGGEASVRLLSPDQPDYKEKIWDQAAGALIVEEAGGRVSDLAGRPFDFTTGRLLLHNRGVLCSNGSLHPALLQALSEVGV